MRWIGRGLSALVIFVWIAWYAYPEAVSAWKKSQIAGSDLAKARASTFFPLASDNWLVFDIPKNSGLFRVYSHAALTNDIADATANYTVEYQWLDAEGEILVANQHHITTRAANTLPELDLISMETHHRALRFYKHQRNRPSRDHALYFDAREHPEARALRIRTGEKDNVIEQIGIRPYEQHERQRADVDLAWQRMSTEQREKLSAGSLYPSFLLSEFERRNILSTYWKPVGPLGALDRDYRIDTLYQLDAEAPVLPPETPGSDGLFASADHWVTVFLPDDSAIYTIQWQALPEVSVPELISFHWQGMDSSERKTWQGSMNDSNWESRLDRGLLQLAPDRAGLLNLFVLRDGKQVDITPEKRYTRTYECRPNAPLKYALSPGNDPQPLRVDARTFTRADRPAIPGDPAIELKVLDARNRLLYSRHRSLPQNSYPYQHFTDAAWVASEVNEVLTTYLTANPDAATLQIDCGLPSLLNLSSRPWGKAITRRLPAQENVWQSFEDREPAWFTVRPVNAQALLRQKRYQSLLWYFQPYGQEGVLADDKYQRIELHPTDQNVFESQIFSPYPKKGEPRLDILGSAYVPLVSGADIPIAGRNRENNFSANLIYLRKSTSPQSVNVFVDGKLSGEKTIAGKSGRIRLPGVSAGLHRFEVKPDRADWFISNSTLPQQTHLLRTAYGMAENREGIFSLEYQIAADDLPAEELTSVFSVWLYTDKDNSDLECQLDLRAVRQDQVEDTFTLRSHRYVINGAGYDHSYRLQARSPEVFGPIKLSVPIDTDIRLHNARASVSCNKSEVFVSAGLILDGTMSHRQFEERYD